MNLYPHPPSLTVLRRARGRLVSSGQNPFHASLSSAQISLPKVTGSLRSNFRQTDCTQLSLSVIPLHPLGPIQST
jgi:hypothetical protein